jgi:hypothetical protein
MPRGAREKARAQRKHERKREHEPAQSSAVDQELLEHGPTEPEPDPAVDQLVADIAAQLGESEEEPLGTIRRVVVRLGSESALALLQEAQAIEAQGGLWLSDGSRRRTPGGVFFFLVRERTEKPDRLAIFYPEYDQIIPLSAEELAPLLASAPEWPRATAQRVSLLVAGRPAAIPPPDIPPQTPYVIFMLESGVEQAPALAKGLPPVSAPTTYRVLAPTAQWLKLAPALVRQPDARIGVIGYAAINPRRPEMITVRAINIKLLVPRPVAQPPADDEIGKSHDDA